ncbi:MAG: hypothetical protein N5P05_002849 [Chroococcopsis gigantea SAG 12.99]|jgi:uncharacterized metal-binding protein|nr:metal-binding protein [Chlorogloea purpurea SAG 13.99]MDV3001243.1 hypothetical protein [Chroococcopsis gigantea SAG 12.99]
MPSGKTHDRITYSLLPLVIAVSLLVGENISVTLAATGGYLFAGLMFGPDLDIHSVQYKRWGWLRFLWLPYRSMLRHRSFLSHGPIVGTLFRVFYFGSFLLLITIVAGVIMELIWGKGWNGEEMKGRIINILWYSHRRESIALLIGLELGAMSHSLSDWIGSSLKRSHRKTGKKSRR